MWSSRCSSREFAAFKFRAIDSFAQPGDVIPRSGIRHEDEAFSTSRSHRIFFVPRRRRESLRPNYSLTNAYH
jgi:hypothetical protein